MITLLLWISKILSTDGALFDRNFGHYTVSQISAKISATPEAQIGTPAERNRDVQPQTAAAAAADSFRFVSETFEKILDSR